MRIGIPVSMEKKKYTINMAYPKYVENAGYTPVLITPENDPKVVANAIDGLLLPGGIDLDPIYYDEDNFTSLFADPKKDEFERRLFHTCRKRGIPVFGICRGFQLIAREYLLANPKAKDKLCFCRDIDDHNQSIDQDLERKVWQHFVECNLYALYGEESKGTTNIPVNSLHHQAVLVDLYDDSSMRRVGNFHMIAWTDRGIDTLESEDSLEDTVVCEAFEIINWTSPILAVQWHPEEMNDVALLQNFFEGTYGRSRGKTA